MIVSKRSILSSSLSIGLTVVVLSVLTGGPAFAHDSDGADSSTHQTGDSAAKTSESQHSDNKTMNSRMAPTQSTTGSGRNPQANSVDRPTPSAKSGSEPQKAPQNPAASDRHEDDRSTLPRMAPTQNKQNAHEDDKDGS